MRIFNFALVVCLLAASQGFAQEMHSDIEFGYEGGFIEFESDGSGIDSAGVFEADFELEGGVLEAENPGFASNFIEDDGMGNVEEFMVTSGDNIFLNANASATFGTFLTYYNPATGSFESTSATITIEDNSPTLTGDLVISENDAIGDASQFLITSTGAEIDTHVDFILSNGAATGAYGLLLNLESDSTALTSNTSENFWIVFNNGLGEEAYESAVDRFTAVPEPSAVSILLVSSLALLRRNRK
ncbi:MAG: hypothetical protein AAGA30_03390 [Planctomycetota bacterium]